MEGESNHARSEEAIFNEEFKFLMRLIETGNVQDVTEFLDKFTKDRYVELAQKSQNVATLMFQAVQKAVNLGHVEVMDALIFHGFIHDSEDYPDLPPLHAACAAGDLNVVKSLVQKHGVSPDEEDPVKELTPLVAALHKRTNLEIIEVLVSAGASANRRSGDGTSPLLIAAELCSPEVCELLLSHGANVNIRDGSHEDDTPLCSAIYADKISNAICLLDAGADIETNDVSYDSPYKLATNCGNLPMMRLLQSRGACPDCQDFEGNTSLHLAALNGTYEIAKYLAVEIGVRIDTKNDGGETPFMMAVGEGNIDIADMLVKSGYNPKQEELMFDEGDLILSRTGMEEVIKRWKQMLTVPRRLQDLCILQMRRSLRNQSALSSLPLPKHLIDEILMNE